MNKKNGKLTDFDKQLIASMKEAAALAAGARNDCRETVFECADAKAIRQGLGMSQSEFSRAFGIPLKTLQHGDTAATPLVAPHPHRSAHRVD